MPAPASKVFGDASFSYCAGWCAEAAVTEATFITRSPPGLNYLQVFIKTPESLFLLEELRERKYDKFARRIQQTYRRWKKRREAEKLKQQASDILMNRKERQRLSINRNFVGDYIGLEENPGLRALIGKKDRADFTCVIKKCARPIVLPRNAGWHGRLPCSASYSFPLIGGAGTTGDSKSRHATCC